MSKYGAMHKALSTVLWVPWGALLPAGAAAAGECEQAKLIAADAAFRDHFGLSVSVDGDVAVAGALMDDDGGSASGSAYVFRRHGPRWVQEQKLAASDAAPGDWFGFSVSVSGDVIVVGAERDGHVEEYAGSAYVFRYDAAAGTWEEEQKLTASDADRLDNFGYTVAISGDVAIVGSWRDDDAGPGSGSAYVFRFDPDALTWFEEQKLTASDATANDHFGTSVSVSQNPSGLCVAAVGAFLDDDAGSTSGSAYVFRYDPEASEWVEQQKLIASNAGEGDTFGRSVSVGHAPGEALVVVGAPRELNDGNPGSAYVYRFDPKSGRWIEEQELTTPDASADNAFGFTVSLSGEIAVVGNLRKDHAGSEYGAAHVFHYHTPMGEWLEEETLIPSDAEAFDWFGYSVCVSGNTVLVGTPLDDDACPDDPSCESGSGYVFVIGAPDFDEDCDVDLRDYARFTDCVSGPGTTTPPPLCDWRDFCIADSDGDGDVDLLDFATFQEQYTGP